MNIGIDIDNTITNIEKDLFDSANKYTKTLNPNFENKNPVKFDGFVNMANFYMDIFGWNIEQIESFFRNERIEVIDNAFPRPGVVNVLKRLKNMGHNIFIELQELINMMICLMKDPKTGLIKMVLYMIGLL